MTKTRDELADKCQEFINQLIQHYSRENLGLLESIDDQIYVTGKCALVHVCWDDEEQTIKMKLVDCHDEGASK